MLIALLLSFYPNIVENFTDLFDENTKILQLLINVLGKILIKIENIQRYSIDLSD